MAKRKRIPYGMMNFVDVIVDNCYYVDKTRFIEKIENANSFFSLSVQDGSGRASASIRPDIQGHGALVYH